MFLWRLLFTNPMVAIALGVCLATIFWCLAVLRERHRGLDRFLAALIGAICVSQGLRLLQEAGVIAMPGSSGLDSFAELMITGLYLIALLILRISALERKSTEVRLRLVEADEQKRSGTLANRDASEQNISELILGSNPLATIAVNKSGTVIYWNVAAERLLGWKSREVIGKPSPTNLGASIRTKGGAMLRVESWTSPIKDAVGRPSGTIHVLAPINVVEAPPSLACDAPVLAT